MFDPWRCIIIRRKDVKMRDFGLLSFDKDMVFEIFENDVNDYFEKELMNWGPFVRFDGVELQSLKSYDVGFVHDGCGNKIRKRSLGLVVKYLLGTMHCENVVIEISPFECEVFVERVGVYGKRQKLYDLSDTLTFKWKEFMMLQDESYKQYCEFYLNKKNENVTKHLG